MKGTGIKEAGACFLFQTSTSIIQTTNAVQEATRMKNLTFQKQSRAMRCYAKPKLSSNTFRDYFNTFRKFREFLRGDLPIQSIQIGNIAGFNNQNQHLKKTLKIIIRVFPLSTWSSNIWQSPRWISNPPIVVPA